MERNRYCHSGSDWTWEQQEDRQRILDADLDNIYINV